MTRLPPAAAIALALLAAACQPRDGEVADNVTPAIAEHGNGMAPAASSSAERPNGAAPAEAPDAAVSACLLQDGERIADNRIRAIGTEPFWGARVEGRCVTYSTPDDIDGTRVWTQFSGTAENGTWTGYLDNQDFVLRTRPRPGCSDGMSDNRYPIAVSLTVRGEERSGCAAPL